MPCLHGKGKTVAVCINVFRAPPIGSGELEDTARSGKPYQYLSPDQCFGAYRISRALKACSDFF